MSEHLDSGAARPGTEGAATTTATKNPPGSRAARIARLALEAVENDPVRAARLARGARRASGADADTVALAERVMGLAARERGDLHEAEARLRASIRVARTARLDDRAAEAHISLMLVRAYRGDLAGALREADLAGPLARGSTRVDLRLQRANVLQRLGRFEECLPEYEGALRRYRARGDRLSEAQLLLDRGVVHAYRGDIARAERDLGRTRTLARELGQESLAAKALHNLGFVAARAGRIAEALARYEEVDRVFQRLGLPTAVLDLDRCDAFVQAGLYADARTRAERAAEELERAGMAIDLAEALLQVSDASLRAGSADEAARAADRAVATLSRQSRPGWTAAAHLAAVRARFAGGDRSVSLLRAARRARGRLVDAGMRRESVEAALIAGRIALSLRRLRVAREELAFASLARRAREAQSARAGWLAEAFLRLAGEDHPGALAALSAGLRTVEGTRSLLGGSELRASSARLGSEMAAIGLRLALERGRASEVFAWAEAWRTRGLAFPPVAPPSDPELAAALVELRGLVARSEAAARDGLVAPGLAGERQAVERRIRDRTLRTSGGGAGVVRPPGLAEVRRALGTRVLIEIVRADDRLGAVVVDSRGATLHDLGDAAAVDGEVGSLTFALRRLALPGWPGQLRDSALGRARSALDRLSERLVEPLQRRTRDRPLVLVPTGSLHLVPWGVLPGLGDGRPVVVAPSAALWLRAEGSLERRAGRPLVVAGPDLPGGEGEARALARSHTDARLLVGDEATTAAVLEGLAGSPMAHIAAHGESRGDNPLFSSLRLADGPLTVHELEGIRPAPSLLVLPVCDAASHQVGVGDEIRGLAAALLGLGTRTVIAAIGLAPDAASADLMIELHRSLRVGTAPAAALAETLARASIEDPATALATRAAFVCLGSGEHPVDGVPGRRLRR